MWTEACLRSGQPRLVLVDGTDGAGKTTLVAGLVSRLDSNPSIVCGPRLGAFLPCGDDARRFGEWVTSSPVDEVNRTMLFASTRRLNYTWNHAAPGATVALDRGPATVLASCIVRKSQADGLSLADAQEIVQHQLDEHPLYPAINDAELAGVLCYVPSRSLILQRCMPDAKDARYASYLCALHELLTPEWGVVGQHLLVRGDADIRIALSNIESALAV